jgi:hypothetical protein
VPHFPSYALTFGEEASDELGQARRLMLGLTLPVETLAGVRERIAWAHQSAGNTTKASDAFRAVFIGGSSRPLKVIRILLNISGA